MNLILRNRAGFPLGMRPAGFEHPLERLVDSMFEDFVANTGAPQDASALTPRIDVVETPQAFEIEAEIPGVSKDDVRISVEGKRVMVEADVRRDVERKEGESLIHAERIAKRFTRSFTLPVDVDDGQAQARLENGVLRLVLPKKQAAQAKQISVQ